MLTCFFFSFFLGPSSKCAIKCWNHPHKVRDFFRPVEGATFCEMLRSLSKHQWSHDGLTWVTPDYHTMGANGDGCFGGSETWWPLNHGRSVDARRSLSRWGDDDTGAESGGCCSTSYADSSRSGGWGLPFTLSYFADLPVHGKRHLCRHLCCCRALSLSFFLSHSLRHVPFIHALAHARTRTRCMPYPHAHAHVPSWQHVASRFSFLAFDVQFINVLLSFPRPPLF